MDRLANIPSSIMLFLTQLFVFDRFALASDVSSFLLWLRIPELLAIYQFYAYHKINTELRSNFVYS